MILSQNQVCTAIIVGTLMHLWSCGSSGTNETSDTSDSEFESAQDSARSDVVEQIDKVLHELPPPSEIPILLEEVGAEFNSAFTHDISKGSSYETNDKAALNLGIYATDAGYYASYGQIQNALRYMEGCQILAENLGISSAFDMDLLRRFEQNTNDLDTLASLVNEAMEEAEVELENNDRTTVAALALVGSYIEGLYISTQVIENYPKDIPNEERNLVLEPVIHLIADLEPALIDLIAVLNSIERDEIVENILIEMGALRFYYQEIGDLKEKLEEDPAHVVLEGGYLKDVTEEVQRIRDDIISV